MPLNNTDITTLTNRIITKYNMGQYPDAVNTVSEAVTLGDLELEAEYPSYYVGNLIGSTVAQKQFIQARMLYILCKLFNTNADYWDRYSQANSVVEARNSAGSMARFDQNRKVAKLDPKSYCRDFTLLMMKLGAIRKDVNVNLPKVTNYNWD